MAGEPAEWLSFTPAYTGPRRSFLGRPLGAHAFRTGPRSLCGSILRERAGGPDSDDARRCIWCERVIAGRSADHSFSSINGAPHGGPHVR